MEQSYDLVVIGSGPAGQNAQQAGVISELEQILADDDRILEVHTGGGRSRR
jgi:pyruvate/2-oxoglutarate dehydrogenase complex dihydrolipoamide dehydrogenase (E3) component